MNILVTGGAGFIGSQVVKALLERGDEVVIIDDLNSYYDVGLKNARLNQFIDKVEFHQIHISDYDLLKRVFEQNKFDKVCHLAAQAGVRYSIENPFAYEKANGLGTLNILELMKEFGIKDLVFASSSSVYGGNTKIPFSAEDNVDTPISVYAATKKYNELLAHVYHKLHGLNCFGLRFFTVYGPWGRPDMSLFKFTKSILEGAPIDVYNFGKHRRDFTYITDIVDGILKSLDKVQGYEIFNLGNSNTVELMYFISCIEKTLGVQAQKNMLPMQQGDVHTTFADIEKTKEILGWEPRVKIEEGISEFIKWYKNYYNMGNVKKEDAKKEDK
jgi:UDP-glucuronate 4-epimerase